MGGGTSYKLAPAGSGGSGGSGENSGNCGVQARARGGNEGTSYNLAPAEGNCGSGGSGGLQARTSREGRLQNAPT